jgi:hypothetical protein
MNQTLKIYLYTGNHRKLAGIKEYINYFKILSSKFHFKLDIGDTLSNKSSYDFVIFIEEFSNLFQFVKIFFFLKIYPKKTILVLTEFFNTNSKTLNNFEFNNKYFDLIFSINIINILFSFPLKFFFGRIIVIIRIILNFASIILNSFFFSLNSLRELFFITYKGISVQKFIYSYKENLLSHIIKIYNKWYNIFYFKTRFSALKLLISNFDIYLRSHEKIKFTTTKKITTLFFFLKSHKFELSKNKKFAFEFSGDLNLYRKNQIKNIILNKTLYKNIDTKFIKETEKRKSGFYTFSSKQYNFLSLHFKKSTLWPYCSPTRYIDSIDKNYIPIILDNFDDDVAKLLAIHVSKIKNKSLTFFFNLQNKINKNIIIYNKKANLAANSFYNSVRKIK